MQVRTNIWTNGQTILLKVHANMQLLLEKAADWKCILILYTFITHPKIQVFDVSSFLDQNVYSSSLSIDSPCAT